ncbi:MAG: MFS transporter [Planctomycetes bacterium]|nr:MFS transporter [Planctomycetota bacterium]
MKIPAPHYPGKGGEGISVEIDSRSPHVPSSRFINSAPIVRKCRRRTLRKNLRNSVSDGAAFSMMVGIGETYFPAFVLALGLGEIASGLVASIPLLIGAILQMISPVAVLRLGSNRRWVICCVILQALSFVPLVAAAVMGTMHIVGVFGAVSLYWAAGLGAGPAWNTWMETVVPFRVRAPFFAMRTRMGQAGTLLGFLAGGAALQYGKHSDQLLTMFAIIFAVAAVCRTFSARFLSRQSEAGAVHTEQKHVSLGELCSRIRAGSSERLLLYFLAVQVAVQISGPYFNPFMLKQLRISYIDYVGLLATSFLAKIVMLPACGRFATRFGVRRLLWVGGIGIMPVAGLWLYAHTYVQLVALQFLAGAVWAAYELAMFLLFFEACQREERTSILTMFNLANAIALAIGAAFGGGILKLLGQSREAYLFLFAVSSFARAATLILLKLTPEFPTTETEPTTEPAVVLQPIARTAPARSVAPTTASAPAK